MQAAEVPCSQEFTPRLQMDRLYPDRCMSSEPGVLPREELEAWTRRDLFKPAREALDRLFTLVLTTRRDLWVDFGQRIEIASEQLREVELIWHRVGDDSIELIEANRGRSDVVRRLGISSYTIGSGEYPELDIACDRESLAETAIWLDYKSLFVFADILLSVYVQMSEHVWEAPGELDHRQGLSPFLTSADRVLLDLEPGSMFAVSMADLFASLKAIDHLLGFYRDKFITHPRPDLSVVGSGTSLSVPLDFHRSYGRRVQASEQQLRRLRKAVRQVEREEGLRPLFSDDSDPRDGLRALAMRLEGLKHDRSIQTVKNLLKEWGMTSPPVAMVADRLNGVLTAWADRLAYLIADGVCG
jgi:hypothetical protein